MKKPHRLQSANLLCLGTILSLGAGISHADPLPTAGNNTAPVIPPVTAPPNDPDWERVTGIMREASEPRPKRPRGKTIENAILNYEGVPSYSSEVLASKVTVKVTEVPFLAALDAVMDASPKTCRIECRQVGSTRISLNVKDAPVAGLLDAIAKMGSARLYVLPSKLLIAPELQLSKEEKKKAKPYGELLTAATVANVPGAKALAIPQNGNKSILDLANTRISAEIDQRSIEQLIRGRLKMWSNMDEVYQDQFQTIVEGPIPVDDLFARVSMNLHDVKYGDVLASLAHLMGCELYMTSEIFVICPANKYPPGTQLLCDGEPMLKVFAPSSTSFPDLSAGQS